MMHDPTTAARAGAAATSAASAASAPAAATPAPPGDDLEFRPSTRGTLGVELELQCMNTRDHDLSTAAPDLLRLLEKLPCKGEVKPEITESMIELNSAVAANHTELLANLRALRDVCVEQARRLNVQLSGGGAHPFQQWSDQRIGKGKRYQEVWQKYGYLAKQFTVFGQHIHVGCADGDEAIRLAHHLAYYVPAFIALAAASPYFQNQDTLFASSRLTSVNAFPLSGTLPPVRDWAGFSAYFERLRQLGVASSIKDLYWDIRPKPEYGTVEIRVCDTPLTVDKAAALAAWAQALARQFVAGGPAFTEEVYLPYRHNRFHAARYGLKGEFVDARSGTKTTLGQLVCTSIETLWEHARDLDCVEPLRLLYQSALSGRNDADQLREIRARSGSLEDVAHAQARLWAGEAL